MKFLRSGVRNIFGISFTQMKRRSGSLDEPEKKIPVGSTFVRFCSVSLFLAHSFAPFGYARWKYITRLYYIITAEYLQLSKMFHRHRRRRRCRRRRCRSALLFFVVVIPLLLRILTYKCFTFSISCIFVSLDSNDFAITLSRARPLSSTIWMYICFYNVLVIMCTRAHCIVRAQSSERCVWNTENIFFSHLLLVCE